MYWRTLYSSSCWEQYLDRNERKLYGNGEDCTRPANVIFLGRTLLQRAAIRCESERSKSVQHTERLDGSLTGRIRASRRLSLKCHLL